LSEAIIKDVLYRTIFDSRGVETLEVDVYTSDGFGRCAAPFGAPGSRGEFEAPAYGHGGLEKAQDILNSRIIPELKGMNATEITKIDAMLEEIDGTPNFENIGGNTSSVISIACIKAAANAIGEPLFKLLNKTGPWTLPYPLGNIIGGGAHSMGPAPDMQEHLVVPVGAKTIRQAVEIILKVHEETGFLLEKGNYNFTGGADDENAWTADLNDAEALAIIKEASDKVSQTEGVKIFLGLDLAADRLWNSAKKEYEYHREGVTRTTEQQIDFISELIEKYNLIYVEDAVESNDYDACATLNERHGDKCLICADDIYASNVERTKKGLEKKTAGSIIIKTNQVGTISGAAKTAAVAKEGGMEVVVSHRSGETLDESIAHQALAWNALMIKTGVKGGERLAKLNELIRVEDDYEQIILRSWL